MKSIKGIVFALVSSGTFGLIPLFSISLIRNGMGLPSILFYRFLFSAIIMGIACIIQKKCFKVPFNSLVKISILSLLYAITALGLIFSYLYIPSGIATTLHFLYPLLVTIIMTTFFKERKSVALFLSAIVSLIGVGFLTWPGGSILNPIGILMILVIIATYAIYIVGINKSGVSKMDSHILTFYILLLTAFILGLLTFSTTGIEKINNSSGWMHLLLLAFIPTVISNLTLVLAIKYVGSTVTSILGSMEPLVAVCIGILFFKEGFGIFSFIGFLLIILSVIFIILTNKRNSNATIDNAKT